jgi:hypothetical protein
MRFFGAQRGGGLRQGRHQETPAVFFLQGRWGGGHAPLGNVIGQSREREKKRVGSHMTKLYMILREQTI